MKHYLLLGAGFSRNWGGWLADEAFEYLLGRTEILGDPELVRLLWRHHVAGGFEAALAEVQENYRRDPTSSGDRLRSLQLAVEGMFADMNAGYARQPFEWTTKIEYTVVHFLARFDAIFSLNQDLLLEQHYLSTNLSTGPYRNWTAHDLPGMEVGPGQTKHDYMHWSENWWRPRPAEKFAVEAGVQPYFKLHGSSNWMDGAGQPMLIIGGSKARSIGNYPILSWCAQEFSRMLNESPARLMIIGYGFRDEHINKTIENAATTAGLRLYNVAPEGSSHAKALNVTRRNNQIVCGTPLEQWFENSLIGASRRPLADIFSGEEIEHRKLFRFFA